ncbi:hypothetical protein RUND412_005186 [Rhizina undulata]
MTPPATATGIRKSTLLYPLPDESEPRDIYKYVLTWIPDPRVPETPPRSTSTTSRPRCTMSRRTFDGSKIGLRDRGGEVVGKEEGWGGFYSGEEDYAGLVLNGIGDVRRWVA